MTDRPILFSAPMVRALLEGRKTQTRRVLDAYCDEPPAIVDGGIVTAYDENYRPYRWPRTKAVGDRLWVQEAWRVPAQHDKAKPSELERQIVGYDADCMPGFIPSTGRRRASFHMPRWASRLTLIVTDVRVERLQEISEEDARAEGFAGQPYDSDDFSDEAPIMPYRQMFAHLWDSLNAARGYGWDANPWVVAVTFTVHRGNIDEVAP